MNINPQYRTLGKANPVAEPITEARSEEIKAAYQRIAELEAVLGECQDYFEERADVVDGDYGVPGPNDEMRMLNIVDEVLP